MIGYTRNPKDLHGLYRDNFTLLCSLPSILNRARRFIPLTDNEITSFLTYPTEWAPPTF
jgi:hypothetical protein